MKTVSTAEPRVTARLSPDVRHVIEQAATSLGATLNQFLVQAAYERALAVLNNLRTIRMTNQDMAVFSRLLDASEMPAPPAFARAAERYRRLLDDKEQRENAMSKTE